MDMALTLPHQMSSRCDEMRDADFGETTNFLNPDNMVLLNQWTLKMLKITY